MNDRHGCLLFWIEAALRLALVIAALLAFVLMGSWNGWA